MALTDGMVPIKDGETPTGYYVGRDGVFTIRRAGTSEAHLCHCYAHLTADGNVDDLFEFPIAPAEQQTVGRTVGGMGGLSQDLYLQKRYLKPDGTSSPAFRYASAADVIAYRANTRANEAKAAALKKATDPMHRDERLANMLADAMAKMTQQPRQKGA